jgi:hypothetical protein
MKFVDGMGDQKMIKRNASLAVVATVALLMLAGCGSTQDIFGNGNGNQPYTSSIHGTVDYVDTSTRSIVLYNTSGYNTMLSGSNGGNNGSVRVYYDNNTTVQWQGRTFRPEDLERGDQIDVSVRQSGNQLVADSMNVTYNANGTTASYPNNSYPSNSYPASNVSTIRGTVRYVDTSSRTIQLEQTTWLSGFLPGNSNGSVVTVQYDNNVGVNANGQVAPVTNLERGDVVEVQAQNYGNNTNLVASRITLVRDVRR